MTTETTKTAAQAAQTTTQTTAQTHTLKVGLRGRMDEVRGVADGVGGALSTGAKAYVSGLADLGQALGGFGREMLTEYGDHVRASLQAKCLRELVEIQAAYAQHRVEMVTTHSKEFVDLARARTEDVITPFADLLKNNKNVA